MEMSDLKPWPKLFIVLCEPWGKENIFAMSGMTQRNCVDCNCVVSVDPKTIVNAWHSPHRQGRKLWYLCTECAKGYDPKSINIVIKQREHNDEYRATEAQSKDSQQDSQREAS